VLLSASSAKKRYDVVPLWVYSNGNRPSGTILISARCVFCERGNVYDIEPGISKGCAPKSLVLVGQRGGQPMQVAGWVRPRDLVKAFSRDLRGYRAVWQHAQAYLYRLQSRATEQHQQFPKLASYERAFAEVGLASILFILVDQMRDPDAAATPAALESAANPVWMTLKHFSIRLGVSRVREISVAFFFGNTFEK
jgi:hypothetical protein